MDQGGTVSTLRQTCTLVNRTHQRGQAMVEFAIIALLLILLIAGGVELGIAAFNSNRTAEGAKAASNQWMRHLGSGAVYQELGSSSVYGFALNNGGLGDHYNLSAFTRPSCNTDGSYSAGLPNDTDVFLYNPLPIDITECTGNDTLEPSHGRISVLLTGHSNTFVGDPLYHPGLPTIHQAIYSQYERVCVDITLNTYFDCSNFNASNPDHRKLLKLPGVLADGDGLNIGPTNPDSISRLAKIVHDTDSDQFILDEADPDNNVRLYPTFHIKCSTAATDDFGGPSDTEENCDSQSAPGEVCWFDEDTALACNVQVTTRYRHTFETFIGMTMAEGNEPAMTQVQSSATGFFDYQGSAAGTLGNGLQLGNAPKPYRDFLGCHHTSVLTASSPLGPYLANFNTISCN